MRPPVAPQRLFRITPPFLARGYAAGPSTNPHLAAPSDSRVDSLRQILYPQDAHAPSSSSPTGAHHPAHLERLQAVLPSAEAHETIERAWKLFQRERRAARKAKLEAQFTAMQEACDELDRVTRPIEDGGEGYARTVYDRAMARPTLFPVDKSSAKKTSPEARFTDARLEGLVPREAWVPTETRGKGWNYDWKRPKA